MIWSPCSLLPPSLPLFCGYPIPSSIRPWLPFLQVLLDRGARINALELEFNRTPLDYVHAFEDPGVRDALSLYLEARGAKTIDGLKPWAALQIQRWWRRAVAARATAAAAAAAAGSGGGGGGGGARVGSSEVSQQQEGSEGASGVQEKEKEEVETKEVKEEEEREEGANGREASASATTRGSEGSSTSDQQQNEDELEGREKDREVVEGETVPADGNATGEGNSSDSTGDTQVTTEHAPSERSEESGSSTPQQMGDATEDVTDGHTRSAAMKAASQHGHGKVKGGKAKHGHARAHTRGHSNGSDSGRRARRHRHHRPLSASAQRHLEENDRRLMREQQK